MQNTMTVTVRDRNAERPWGSGRTSPVIREVTISARCPRCSNLRGEPEQTSQHEDGVSYSVDVWHNPCGHVDMYADVVDEAASLAAGGA